VLIGAHETIVYTYHAGSRARLKIMWERAQDRAEAASQPVEWTGDRSDGIDDSILVPEIAARVEESHQRCRASGQP
jgi:hypothetical protein